MSSKAANISAQATPSVATKAAGLLQRSCSCGQHTFAGSQCEDCTKKSGQSLQHTAVHSSPSGFAPPIVDEVLASTGNPLDEHTRDFMEQRFHHDFSHVRIHTDGKAAESAKAVDALAYTVGKNVVLGAGQYAPETSAGRRLLAHELTHVVQQQSVSSFGALRVGAADSLSEREADAAASNVMLGLPVQVQHGSVALQRYGHAHSCKGDEHLKPFVWPGHDHAKRVTQRAVEETDGRPLNPKVKGYLPIFFGTKSTDPANVAKINANFKKIQTALNQQYLYHCSSKGDTSDKDAIPCKGQNAETNRSGQKDVTLCFDQVKGWSPPEAAWVIVHENVHRGLDVWGHAWHTGKVAGCVTKQAETVDLELDNADAYACFAVFMGNLG